MKKNLFNALFVCVCVALVLVSVDSVNCHRANTKLLKKIHKLCVEADYVRASDNNGSTYDLRCTLPKYPGKLSK